MDRTIDTATPDGSIRDRSVDRVTAALEHQARLYLQQAWTLDASQAADLPREATAAVMATWSPGASGAAGLAVIQVARRLAAGSAAAGDGRPDLVPVENGRSMRVQPLDPMTLAELGTHSRRSGRRLANALPRWGAVAWGTAALVATMLALPRPPL